MDKKKPIGYTKEQTKSMKALIERTQEKAGDYVGSGTVTTVPKKKKKMKRMQMGGMANAMRVRGGGGVPIQGPGGVVVLPMPPEMKGTGGMMNRSGRMARPGVLNRPYSELRAGAGPFSLMDKTRARSNKMRGGGLAKKGIGMALAKGGLVKANGCAQRGKSKGKMV